MRMHQILTALAALLLIGISTGPATAQGSGDWPMLAGNPERTNSAGPPLGPGTGALLWQYETPKAMNFPPGVANEMVYLAYAGRDIVGGIHAMNAHSGNIIWKIDSGPVIHQPVVRGNVVLFGTMIDGGKAGEVVAANALNGETIWRNTVNGRADILLVEDGVVYVGERPHESLYGLLYAFSLDSGELLWYEDSVTPRGLYKSTGTLVIAYLHGLVANLDIATRDSMWEYQAGQHGASAPAVSQGIVVVLGSEGPVALDLDTGEKLWNYESAAMSHPPAPIIDDVVLAPSYNGLHVLELETGKLIRTLEVGSVVGVAAQGDTAFVTSYTHPQNSEPWQVTAINMETEEIYWNFSIPYTYRYPVVVDGILYQPYLTSSIGDHDEPGGVFALDAGYLKALERGDFSQRDAEGEESVASSITAIFLVTIIIVARHLQRRP